MRNRDIKNSIDTALEKGREEGRAEGEKNKALQIAKKMLDKGLEVDSIMEMTNLTREEIERL